MLHTELLHHRPCHSHRRCLIRGHHSLHPFHQQESAWFTHRHHRHDRRRHHHDELLRHPCRHHRRQVRNQPIPARSRCPLAELGQHQGFALASAHHSSARCHREPALRHSGRWYHWTQARLKSGTHWSGHCQRAQPHLRRHPSHRCHRPHHDQHQQWR